MTYQQFNEHQPNCIETAREYVVEYSAATNRFEGHVDAESILTLWLRQLKDYRDWSFLESS